MHQSVKNLVYPLIPLRLRYPAGFWSAYQFAQQSESWARQRLIEYQWLRLKETVDFAYRNSEYYRTVFDRAQLKPHDISSAEVYRQRIPVLTKTQLQKNLASMLSLPTRQLEYFTTGGSTGVPIGLYLDRSAHCLRDAFDWRRCFNKGGYQFGDFVAVLRGRVLSTGAHLVDRKANHLVLSTFDMTESNLHRYVELIGKYRAKHIRAYPSAAYALSRFVSANYARFNEDGALHSIFTSSEVLFPFQKTAIESAFKVKVFDLYGNSEQTSRFATCAQGNYHDYMEYAYSEFLDDNDQPVHKGIARLISTSFANRALPLLRYDTGDLVEVDCDNHCPCGMEHTTVKRIRGRAQEFLIGRGGERISVAALNSHTDAFDHVERFRYVQDEPGKAVLEIVKSSGFLPEDEIKIAREAFFRTNGNVDLTIEHVDAIPLTKAGKFSFVVNRIPQPQLENEACAF